MKNITLENRKTNGGTATHNRRAAESLELSPAGPATVTDHEAQQVERANATGRQPVVFIHGLWLLPGSWDRWAALFDAAGYVALMPGWPDDPDTVAEPNAHPEVMAGKSIGAVPEHFAVLARGLTRTPAV